MNIEDLEQTLGKRIKGVACEKLDDYYIAFFLTYGKKVVLRSETPIYVDIETEQ